MAGAHGWPAQGGRDARALPVADAALYKTHGIVIRPVITQARLSAGIPALRRGALRWLFAFGFKHMINDIYNARILALAAEIPRLGRLAAPQASAKAHSRLCGSTVIVDLAMEGDRVTDFAHEVRACALGQASSSLMARHVVGASAQQLRALRQQVLKMLKENGPPPDGPFDDFKVLEPIRDYKARHASTLLTFDAVVDCIDQIEARRAADPKPVAEAG